MIETGEKKERFILVGVSVCDGDDTVASLNELEELAATAGAETVGKMIQSREQIHPGTYLGKGKLDELRDMIDELGADGIVCDDELSPAQMKNLEEIRIIEKRVMTVENLTSFNRIQSVDTFLIFLSGYHNSAKQDLIRKIYEKNVSLRWVHFGDIDPEGFYILEHLKRGTGIDVEPVYMNSR